MKRKPVNMFREETKELLDLAWRVADETDHRIRCTLSTERKALYLDIRETKESAYYAVYLENKTLIECSKEDCRKAKEHLLRILEEEGGENHERT